MKEEKKSKKAQKVPKRHFSKKKNAMSIKDAKKRARKAKKAPMSIGNLDEEL